MPDTERPTLSNGTAPADWSGAFATLPMETPPSGGWQRVTQALDASDRVPRRQRWPLWLAAAAIGAVALVPALHRSNDATRAPTESAPLAAHKRVPVDTSRPPIATSKRPETRVATAPTQQPESVHVPSSESVDGPGETPLVATATPAPRETAPDPQAVELRAQLASLQSESAQLETLVALARDDRVASASSAALAVEFDRRIGRIDASLSQPGLDDADRAALWQARVSAMRELAGIETTQRWLVASGERYDGALVSVD